MVAITRSAVMVPVIAIGMSVPNPNNVEIWEKYCISGLFFWEADGHQSQLAALSKAERALISLMRIVRSLSAMVNGMR